MFKLTHKKWFKVSLVASMSSVSNPLSNEIMLNSKTCLLQDGCHSIFEQIFSFHLGYNHVHVTISICYVCTDLSMKLFVIDRFWEVFPCKKTMAEQTFSKFSKTTNLFNKLSFKMAPVRAVVKTAANQSQEMLLSLWRLS